MPTQTPRLKDVPRNLKGYFLCLLKKGEKWNETEGSTELMPQHLAFLRQQMEAGGFWWPVQCWGKAMTWSASA